MNYWLVPMKTTKIRKVTSRKRGRKDEKSRKKKQKRKGITMLYINSYVFCTTGLSYY
jgi:hypothetical protein